MRRVVVTGMGVISPVGNSVREAFENLTSGVCGIGLLDRFDTADFKVKIAAQVKNFDITAYGMDKNDERRMDLYSRFAMAAAKQAVEESGIIGTLPEERLGVYVGSGIGGMSTFLEEAIKVHDAGPRRVSPLFIPKMIGNIASGNIAIKYAAKGPNLPVVTACATSTHGIGEAYRAIMFGFADAIIAGGAEATINPLAVAGFSNATTLSTAEDPLESSLPFDARRSGFVMGEGAGVLILEEYEHAKARGAEMYCEIVGYENTCDAYHITSPDPESKQSARAIAAALKQAGFTQGETLYINAHGTGTQLNDSAETQAIKLAMGQEAYNAHISSTKSMTGHTLGAAGAIEAIASIMAIRTGIIPPTIGYKQPDPACDLDYTPVEAKKMKIDLAISTSLGFGGHNGCVAFRKI